MGFGSDEYVDYTLLKKKGLLKLPIEKAEKPIKADGGFIDFTAFGSSDRTSAPVPSEGPAPNFDFLSNMASAGAANNPSSVNPLAGFDTYSPSTSTSGISGSVDAKEINALKIKIDDLDYKINSFIEKFDKIEEKLSRLNLG